MDLSSHITPYDLVLNFLVRWIWRPIRVTCSNKKGSCKVDFISMKLKDQSV
jgi:hypothetical protein